MTIRIIALIVCLTLGIFAVANAESHTKDDLWLTLKVVKSTCKAGEQIGLVATLFNKSNQKKTVREAKQMGFTLYNPQFDLYISGTGANGTQYLNMMGMFGGDKNSGIVLAPKSLFTWNMKESTQPKMVNGSPYGSELPPGQYRIYAEGAGLRSNEVKITVTKR